MTRTTLLSLMIAVVATAPTRAADDLFAQVEEAARTADVEALVAVTRDAAAALAAEDTLRHRYVHAYSSYVTATLLMAQPQRGQEAAVLLEAAQKSLEESIEGLDGNARADRRDEALARQISEFKSLLAGILGMRIGLQPALGMRFGPRSQGLLADAIGADPSNPRAHLQSGISAFNTPEMWGGGHKKAEKALREAVSLFAGESPKPGEWPTWGRLDALAWLGQSLAAQGQIDQARAAYQQALALDPEMPWIRFDLLPKLEEMAEGGR